MLVDAVRAECMATSCDGAPLADIQADGTGVHVLLGHLLAGQKRVLKSGVLDGLWVCARACVRMSMRGKSGHA